MNELHGISPTTLLIDEVVPKPTQIPSGEVHYTMKRVGVDDAAFWVIADENGNYITESDEHTDYTVLMRKSALECVYMMDSWEVKPTHINIENFNLAMPLELAVERAERVNRYLLKETEDRRVHLLFSLFGDKGNNEDGVPIVVEKLPAGACYFAVPEMHTGRSIFYLLDHKRWLIHIPSGERYPPRYAERYWTNGKLYRRGVGAVLSEDSPEDDLPEVEDI